MRVSELFGLSGNQGTFDFVDVDVETDTELFIDPSTLAHMDSEWADSCTSGIQTFFQEVLDRIRSDDGPGAIDLLSHLQEDNSTHLGYSSRSQGSGVGFGLAERFFDELSTSRAVRSGLITDLEDTALLIEGVREDRISDVTTNIIRLQLVNFTNEASDFYGIPTQAGLSVPPYWDGHSKSWEQQTVSLPVGPQGPILLVPKSIVRRRLFLDPSEYYRHYVLEYFKAREIERRSPLTYVIKSGAVRARKQKMEEEIRERHRKQSSRPGIEKRINVEGTEDEPGLLDKYKQKKRANPPRPLPSNELSDVTLSPPLDLNALLADVVSTPEGNDAAHAYERAVEGLLSALMYPELVNPKRQERQHGGRKIIDISYTNLGRENFFYWLSHHYPAAHVFAECKNYSRPIGNPEFDQLSGRFSPSRGQYGLLVYRGFVDKSAVMQSCIDTAHDSRGYMTPLDDEDLAVLVEERVATGSASLIGGLLHQRFRALID